MLVPFRDQLRADFGLIRLFLLSKAEEIWQWLPVWQACILVAKLIEVRIEQGLKRSWSLSWIIAKKSGDEINSFSGCPMSEYFLPGEGFDLRKAVLGVFWVHGENLLTRWRSQNFDYLYKLVNTTLTREDGLT